MFLGDVAPLCAGTGAHCRYSCMQCTVYILSRVYVLYHTHNQPKCDDGSIWLVKSPYLHYWWASYKHCAANPMAPSAVSIDARCAPRELLTANPE